MIHLLYLLIIHIPLWHQLAVNSIKNKTYFGSCSNLIIIYLTDLWIKYTHNTAVLYNGILNDFESVL